MKNLNLLCIGDVVGTPGIDACKKAISQIPQESRPDLVIINGENSAKEGRGLIPEGLDALLSSTAGIPCVVTSGNHIWKFKQIYPVLDQSPFLIRPANFPENSCPGKGWTSIEVNNLRVAVINLLGRVFLKEHTLCPFLTFDKIWPQVQDHDFIVVDFHGEATSEKAAFANWVDGRASLVFGTHTHVQTNDAQILPQGTAFLTDLGAVCSARSILGMAKEEVTSHFLTQMPVKFRVDTQGPIIFSALSARLSRDKNHKLELVRRYVD